MATIYILKNVNNEVALKVVADGGGTVELKLSDLVQKSGFKAGGTLEDLKACEGSPMELYKEYDEKTGRGSTIIAREVQWCAGDVASDYIEIKRGGKHYLWCYGGPQGILLLDGSLANSDNTLANEDFTFECAGNCDLYLQLRKSGYEQIYFG